MINYGLYVEFATFVLMLSVIYDTEEHNLLKIDIQFGICFLTILELKHKYIAGEDAVTQWKVKQNEMMCKKSLRCDTALILTKQ